MYHIIRCNAAQGHENAHALNREVGRSRADFSVYISILEREPSFGASLPRHREELGGLFILGVFAVPVTRAYLF